MSYSYRPMAFAMALLASLPLTAAAQSSAAPNPADGAAAVPATSYESTFRHYRASAADEEAPPDQTWRALNDEMGRLGGHVGHLQQATSKPAAQPAAANSPTPHSRQQHHHH